MDYTKPPDVHEYPSSLKILPNCVILEVHCNVAAFLQQRVRTRSLLNYLIFWLPNIKQCSIYTQTCMYQAPSY